MHDLRDTIPAAAQPLEIQARQWAQGAWRDIDEVASREERFFVEYPGGTCTLWAWPHGPAPLALGHVQLDRLPGDLRDTPVPLRGGSVTMLPAQGGNMAARVELGDLLGEAPQDARLQECGTASQERIRACMAEMLHIPGMWSGTGCFHRAALVRLDTGELVAMSEDIGRHNCLDRLVGQCCLRGEAPWRYALFITARITASLYCKARRAGLACLVSRSAVTSAALTRAREQGITLVGFCRTDETRFTVFADAAGRMLP